MTSGLIPPSLNSSNRSKQSVISGNRASISASPSDGFNRDLGPPTPNTEEDLVPSSVSSRGISSKNSAGSTRGLSQNNDRLLKERDANSLNDNYNNNAKNPSSKKFSSFIKKIGANLKSELRDSFSEAVNGLKPPTMSDANYRLNSRSVRSISSSPQMRVAWDGSFLSPAMTDQPQLTQQSFSRRHWFQAGSGSTPSSVLESQLFYRDINSPHSVFRRVSSQPATRSATQIEEPLSPHPHHSSLRKRLRHLMLGDSDSPVVVSNELPKPSSVDQSPVPETDIGAAQSLSKNTIIKPRSEANEKTSHSDDDEEESKKDSHLPKTAEGIEAENNPGLEHWLEQRRKWTTPKKGAHLSRSTFAEDLDPASYPKVYRLLIDNQRRLKHPMRLGLALKIIQAGWVATGQWPPTPIAESTATLRLATRSNNNLSHGFRTHQN